MLSTNDKQINPHAFISICNNAKCIKMLPCLWQRHSYLLLCSLYCLIAFHARFLSFSRNEISDSLPIGYHSQVHDFLVLLFQQTAWYLHLAHAFMYDANSPFTSSLFLVFRFSQHAYTYLQHLLALHVYPNMFKAVFAFFIQSIISMSETGPYKSFTLPSLLTGPNKSIRHGKKQSDHDVNNL